MEIYAVQSTSVNARVPGTVDTCNGYSNQYNSIGTSWRHDNKQKTGLLRKTFDLERLLAPPRRKARARRSEYRPVSSALPRFRRLKTGPRETLDISDHSTASSLPDSTHSTLVVRLLNQARLEKTVSFSPLCQNRGRSAALPTNREMHPERPYFRTIVERFSTRGSQQSDNCFQT